MQIPARLCFLWHANGRTAHTATELWIEEKWAFHDVTYGVRVELTDGMLAEARELRGEFRELAHSAYRETLAQWNMNIDHERGGDLLESIGICNYLIDGVEEIR